MSTLYTLHALRQWCGPFAWRWTQDDVAVWDDFPRDEQYVRLVGAIGLALAEAFGLVAGVMVGIGAIFTTQGITWVTLTIAVAVLVPLAWVWLRA